MKKIFNSNNREDSQRRSVLPRHILLIALFAGMLAYQAPGQSAFPTGGATGDSGGGTFALRGNVHPLARPEFDQGAVADSQPVGRILLLLKRRPEQETALRNIIDGQQSKSSSNYHQWLTPEQFGRQFGPSDSDIQKVTDWLGSNGFQNIRVSAGRTTIEFSGNAGQLRRALQTEIHRFRVNGEDRFANNADPRIPTALGPLVQGFASLNNFPRRAQNRVLGEFQKEHATGTISPLFTFAGCSSSCFGIGPGDFAAIYGVQSLWNESPAIDGGGQAIAIVGNSEICTAGSPDFGSCASDDVQTFRSLFGLPANAPNVIVDGINPGFNGDEVEGDLDVQWAGAVAKNATIDYVIAADTESTSGIDLAAEYIVDRNLAPILSESYSECEAFLLDEGNIFYSNLWEQAAAQGITVIVSSDDTGSAGCDDPEATTAQTGNHVNGIASTPFNVAVGGTDFDTTSAGYPSAFWNTSNSSIGPLNGVSAKGYIPETTWNDSCAQNYAAAATVGCNPPANLTSVNIAAGGGGQSNCSASSNSSNLIVCSFGYAKPPWQSGPFVTGSANTDGSRDLPDVSLFSADGLVSNSFYIICNSHLTHGPCNLNTTFIDFVGVGGTSSSTPAFAGMMALVNQSMAMQSLSARQGNANYVLYRLPGNTFHDIVKGNNSVPCLGKTLNCGNVTDAGSYGILEPSTSTGTPSGSPAFAAGAGYDLATGLGSVNAANLVSNWASTVGTFTPTTTTLCLLVFPNACGSPVTVTHGRPVNVNFTVSPNPGNPAGKAEDVTLIATFAAGTPGCTASSCTQGLHHHISGSIDEYVLPLINGSNTFETSSLPAGSYTVTAHYSGDGVFGSSDSTPPIPVTVNPENSETILAIATYEPASGTTVPLASVPYGDFNIIRVDVLGSGAPGEQDATGTVTLMDNNGPIADFRGNPASSFALNGDGYTEDQTGFLGVGKHSITAQYNGDPGFNAGTISSPQIITITQAPTITTISASPSASTFTLNALVETKTTNNPSGGSMGEPPSGTIGFFAAGTNLGTVNVTSTPDASGFAAASASLTVPFPNGVESVMAVYSGDANYMASTSVTTNVSPTFTLSSAGGTISVAGAGSSATQALTLTAFDGFTGSITLSCGVTPSSLTEAPTCSLNPATAALSAGAPSAQSMLTVNTTARQSAATARSIRSNGSLAFVELMAGLVPLLMIFSAKRWRMTGVAMLVLCGITSCGGGTSGATSATTNPGVPGTTVASYLVTVTAMTASGGSQQVAIRVNVQ